MRASLIPGLLVVALLGIPSLPASAVEPDPGRDADLSHEASSDIKTDAEETARRAVSALKHLRLHPAQDPFDNGQVAGQRPPFLDR